VDSATSLPSPEVTGPPDQDTEALQSFRESIGHFLLADVIRSAPVLADLLAWAENNAQHPDVVRLSELAGYCDVLELADNVRERGCAEGLACFMKLGSANTSGGSTT
jgi:hypothetical protein